jgi:AcrR family transcriptional regulator
MARPPVPAAGPRRAGRPPRISRAAIASAAHEIGLRDLTLRSVADHLGVSIPALYHHVEGKEDLLRLAAEHAMASRTVPVDSGQHWARWLFEWAAHNRRSFAADPGLLDQYLSGAISVDTIVDNEEAVIAVLVRQGFGRREALASFSLVSSLAIGAAVHEIRDQRARDAGTPLPALPEVLRRRRAGDLPELRRLVAESAAAGEELPPGFDEQVTAVILGIAGRRGDDVAAVLDALA